MRKIKEALRLKAAGLGNREIAASIGAGKTTLYELLARAEGAGICWPLPDDLDDEQLEAILYPPPSTELAERRPIPDWREVHRELKRKRHVTLRLLWLEWKETNPDGWGYTQYCVHYKEWLGGQEGGMGPRYRAGERMFVDFSGDTMQIFDQTTGESKRAEVFVAVLGCSGLLYVEATRGQDLRSWLSAHEHAYSYYGGVTEMTVPDNLKSGITKACFYDPEINPSYADLASHYRTAVLPTRAAKPRDKAAVEAGVLVAERWVLAPLRNRTFHSLAELNAAIRAKVAELNARAFRGEPTSRRELFCELERDHLRALPAGRFELPRWRGA